MRVCCLMFLYVCSVRFISIVSGCVVYSASVKTKQGDGRLDLGAGS